MARRFKTRAWSVESILDLLNLHKSSKDVAELLGVSEFTIWSFMRKNHIKRENCYVIEIEVDEQKGDKQK